MENYKVMLRKSQWLEIRELLILGISKRTRIQRLHYSEMFLLHQALKRFLNKAQKMDNEFNRNPAKERRMSFLPHEAMILFVILSWVENNSAYSKITIMEFCNQIEAQSDQLKKYMVGKLYRMENLNDMRWRMKFGELMWDEDNVQQ